LANGKSLHSTQVLNRTSKRLFAVGTADVAEKGDKEGN
jgi:hypothetical protein